MADSEEPSEAEVEAVIAEFGGDLRAALKALLHDIAVLAADLVGSVSYGYVRGRVASRGAPRASVEPTHIERQDGPTGAAGSS